MKSCLEINKNLDYNFQTMLYGKKSFISFRKVFIFCMIITTLMIMGMKKNIKNFRTMKKIMNMEMIFILSIQFHILVFTPFKQNIEVKTSINQYQKKVYKFL